MQQEGAALPTFSGVGKSATRQTGESGSLLKRSEDGIMEVLWRPQQQPASVNHPAGTFPNYGVSKQICGGASVEGPENRIADFFISRPENKSNIPALWFLPLQPVISIVMKKHEGPKRRLVAPRRFYSNYVLLGLFGASKKSQTGADVRGFCSALCRFIVNRSHPYASAITVQTSGV